MPEKTVKRIVLNTTGAIEPILLLLREKIQKKVDDAGDDTLGCPVRPHRLFHC